MGNQQTFRLTGRAGFLLLAMCLSACQPTVEERFSDAEIYMRDGEYRSAVIELKNILQAEPDRLDARMMLADASYRLFDLADAESEYRRLLAVRSDDSALWVAYGRTLLAQGRAEDALETVAPNIESIADSATASLLGEIYLSLGNSAAAAERFAQALAIDPTFERAMVGTALVAGVDGDLLRSSSLLDAALDAHPESPFVMRSKGDVLGSLRRFDEAAAIYERAINAELPSTPLLDRYILRQNRIAALIEAGQLEQASADLDVFETMVPDHPLIMFHRGRIAFGAGDTAAAETELLKYLAVIPSDAHAQAILGAIKFSQNNLGQAEQYLSGAVRADIGGETTRLLLAETQLRLNQSEDAINILQSTTDTAEQSAVTLAMLGRAKLGEGDTEGAIAYFQQSLTREADSDSVNLALAASYIASDRAQEAIDILKDMPPAEDANYRRETLLMGAYLQSDDAAAAEEVAKALIRRQPDDADVHAIVGVLYASLEQESRARAQLETALGIDAGNIGALYAFGMLAVSAGDRDDAITQFLRVLDVQATHLPALVQLASLLEQNGRLADFRPRLAAARSAAPNSAQLYKLGARTELLLGNTDAALTDIEAGRQAFPNDADFLRLDGVARLQRGETDAAIARLAEAVSRQPENPSNHIDLARARLANGDFGQAVTAIVGYRELRPGDVRGLAIEVDARIRSGDPARAIESVDAFEAANPDEPFVQMLRGDIAFASGDAAGAIDWYERYAANNWSRIVALRLAGAHQATGSGQATSFVERWLEQEPGDSSMRRFYGQLLEANGRVDDAISQYERLERENRLDAIGLNNLAWQYMLKGVAGASDLARRAHEMRPDSGDIADTWGWILHQEGQSEQALEVLRQATEQSPDNREIQYHLAVVLSATGRAGEAEAILEGLLADGVNFPSYREAEALSRTL